MSLSPNSNKNGSHSPSQSKKPSGSPAKEERASPKAGGGSNREAMNINVSFNSIMAGSTKCVIGISKDATIRDLKTLYQAKTNCNAEMVVFIFNGKELSNDDAQLSEYGLVKDCDVTVSAHVESGLRDRNPSRTLVSADMVPATIEQLVQIQAIRETIRNMHNVPGKTQVDPPPNLKQQDKSLWTPEKQMEHQMTRSRMKDLLKRRKETKDKNPSISPKNTDSHFTSSREGSVGGTPMGSEPGTPRHELTSSSSRSSIGTISTDSAVSATAVVEPLEAKVTEKETKLFFDPPETARESIVLQLDLYDPPRNKAELQQLKKEMKQKSRTLCRVCRKKLPISQQNVLCACGYAYCQKHRNPEDHRCNVDYKLTGRKKLAKQNPKIEAGGSRKAKP